MNHLKQKDAMDCGPTCLAMVVKHYGRKPYLEQIRENYVLSKEGVSLLGISKAAEKRGLHSLGGRISFDTHVNEVPLPVSFTGIMSIIFPPPYHQGQCPFP